VVVHGDHGERLIESSLEYRWYRLWRDVLGAKRTAKREGHETDVYEVLIRVPLVLVAPGRIGAGVVVDQLVRQVDLGPTLLDLAGVPVPPGLDGTSLLPAIGGANLQLEAFVEAFGRVRGSPRDRRAGWRGPRWKCITAPQAPDVADELYDLAADPRERRNMAREHSDVVRELRARIDAVEATAAGDVAALSDAEQATIERRLRELGYVE
jgi:arylsulfatase A-like enzyme